jgi:electron transport complex protein RnfE
MNDNDNLKPAAVEAGMANEQGVKPATVQDAMSDVAEKTESSDKAKSAKKEGGLLFEFTKGLIKQNPSLVMLLGMCPTLAVTTGAMNGLGMGLATTFVLVCSNAVISLLKNIIPKEVRIPAYITVIAGFVTLIKVLMEYYIPSLYSALGIFLSLIVVNCIIFGRAEVFASKNKVLPSVLDGLGMGFGFTFALLIVGSIREILGSGAWFGMALPWGAAVPPMLFFILPAGGFFTLGIVVAAIGKLTNKPVRNVTCEGCPNRSACKNAVCAETPEIKREVK